jgi:CBS domain-containing protein
MVWDVRTVQPETPALKAAQLMTRQQIRHLVVTGAGFNVVGVLSERDILKHLSPWLTEAGTRTDHPLPALSINHIMAHAPITVKADAASSEASQLLVEKKIGCLPVVDDYGCLVGILTATDLLKCAGLLLPKFGDQEQVEFFSAPAPLGRAVVTDDGAEVIPRKVFPEIAPDTEISAVMGYQ